MSSGKVLWHEGMHVHPHHYQQQSRYFEDIVEARCATVSEFGWGFKELKIDSDQLKQGRVALSRACGVFPDGTPFDIEDSNGLPLGVDIDDTVEDVGIYLAIPQRNAATHEISDRDELLTDERNSITARYFNDAIEVSDLHRPPNSTKRSARSVQIAVGRLHFRLLLETEPRKGYVTLGIAKIRNKNNGIVELDNDFIPTVVDCTASRVLTSLMNDLLGTIRLRAESLSNRVGNVGEGGDVTPSLLWLMLTNRYEPTLTHLSSTIGVHPERLFSHLLAMAGELYALVGETRIPPRFETYRHDDLTRTYRFLIDDLKRLWAKPELDSLVTMPLKYHDRQRAWVSIVDNRDVLSTNMFVLAVRAEIGVDELRESFPRLTAVGPVESISERMQSGVKIGLAEAQAASLKRVPSLSEAVYFQLEKRGQAWEAMKTSDAFAFHVDNRDSFPGLELNFWSVRSGTT